MEHLTEHLAATQIVVKINNPDIFEAAKTFINQNKEKTENIHDTYLWRIIIKNDDKSMEIKIPRNRSEQKIYLDLITIIMQDSFANQNIIAEVVRDSSFNAIKAIIEKQTKESNVPHYWYIKIGIYDYIKDVMLESLDIKIPKIKEELFKEIMEIVINEYIPPTPSQAELETLKKELKEKLPASEFGTVDDMLVYYDYFSVTFVESNVAWDIVEEYIISTAEEKLGFQIEITEWGASNNGHFTHKYKRKE